MITTALRIDPTRTTLIRKRFASVLDARFNRLKQAIQQTIAKEDALALNTRWKYLTPEQQIEQFKLWLQLQVDQHILTKQQSDDWLKAHIAQAYNKGHNTSYDDVRKPAVNPKIELHIGGKIEFKKLAQSKTRQQVDLLTARAKDEIKGVTDAMQQQIIRELHDGLQQGLTAKVIAKNMLAHIDNIGRVRARRIANTETVRAHAEGQLDALQSLGVSTVGVHVETAGDGKVCERCLALVNAVLTIEEARGVIPIHPEDRCKWLPANFNQLEEQQFKNKRRVHAAIKRSLTIKRAKRKVKH